MSGYSLDFPEDFGDYEWELKSKGCFSEAKLSLSGKLYRLNFYDPGRLAQEIESELQHGMLFFEPNLMVVKFVTRLDMEKAAELLVQSGQAVSLIPD